MSDFKIKLKIRKTDPGFPRDLIPVIDAMDMLIDHYEMVGRPKKSFHLSRKSYTLLECSVGMPISECEYRGCEIKVLDDE